MATTMNESIIDIEPLNAMFETADPSKIIEWAASAFHPQDVVMSSSFGIDSAVLLHMATQILPDIKIVFSDTGYHFPETHAHLEHLRERLNLNVWIYHTRNDPIAYLHKSGEENPAWRKDRDRCCGENKEEPFERAMKELHPKVWLRGTRRDQTSIRKASGFVDWFARYNCYAVSPLLNLDRRTIHAYVKKYDLPYHPLFEQGYSSVGCNPLSCTRPIQIGEDARAGRWSGSEKVECGINVEKNSLDSANI